MAEAPPDQSPTRTRAQPESDPDSSQYWCYHCDKRVAVETIVDVPDIVCYECKNGFVESISGASPTAAASEPINDPTSGNQFIQVLRHVEQTARDDWPLTLPSDPIDDALVEFDGWDNDGWDTDDDEQAVEVVQEEDDNREAFSEINRSAGEEEEEYEAIEPNDHDYDDDDDGDGDGDDDDDAMPRRAREVLRLRLREYAARAESRRIRILDWAELLIGFEDHPVELELQVPESDSYAGNPGDYVDAAGYETLLQNLADSDGGGRRGAPPAGKAVVEGLESVVIGKEEEVVSCAICMDSVNVHEVAKNLPCGHWYHGECIVQWLEGRNSCPLCRFELLTDDLEYEEERRKRVVVAGLGALQ